MIHENFEQGQMNKLFEEFVYKMLKRYVEKTNIDNNENYWEIKYQKGFSLDDDKRIRIYPDIVVFKNGNPFIVLDTKYKLINENNI